MILFHYAIAIQLVAIKFALAEFPSICSLSGLIQPGSVIAASLNNPQRLFCSATLTFEDDNFAPVQANFATQSCPSSKVTAEITLPVWAPAGALWIWWDCAGQSESSCSQYTVTSGRGDLYAERQIDPATVRCEEPDGSIGTANLSNAAGVSSSNGLLPPYPLSYPNSTKGTARGTAVLNAPKHASSSGVMPLGSSSADAYRSGSVPGSTTDMGVVPSGPPGANSSGQKSPMDGQDLKSEGQFSASGGQGSTAGQDPAITATSTMPGRDSASIKVTTLFTTLTTFTVVTVAVPT